MKIILEETTCDTLAPGELFTEGERQPWMGDDASDVVGFGVYIKTDKPCPDGGHTVKRVRVVE